MITTRKKRSTWQRAAREAKRMAGEHALHASAHLRRGDYRAAAEQFGLAHDYAKTAAHAAWMAEEAVR
jgi:hypothetical protein